LYLTQRELVDIVEALVGTVATKPGWCGTALVLTR
jgi:hypothetical protein